MYLVNKYTLCYYSVIEKAQNRVIEGYIEKHHIIPKCLGGSNDKSNLIKLTAREHFVCHWLLTKMTVNKERDKMVFAWWMLSNGKAKITSRSYESAKKHFKKSISLENKGRPSLTKGIPRSEEVKKKISLAKKGKITKHRGEIWLQKLSAAQTP